MTCTDQPKPGSPGPLPRARRLDRLQPAGGGLSSSAAIEVATLHAACALSENLSPVEIARTARAVENDFVGVPGGIMDPFAISVGTPLNALFPDISTLAHQPAPLPGGDSFPVIHSGLSHRLAASGDARRDRRGCRSRPGQPETPSTRRAFSAAQTPEARTARHNRCRWSLSRGPRIRPPVSLRH
ncbi:MAG: hypothetical protein CSA74_03735 [Rhodobacterales bacterium]|nr:MAG: hypothetical protein CSA74_03735 [Rhodobacterales bacterium]